MNLLRAVLYVATNTECTDSPFHSRSCGIPTPSVEVRSFFIVRSSYRYHGSLDSAWLRGIILIHFVFIWPFSCPLSVGFELLFRCIKLVLGPPSDAHRTWRGRRAFTVRHCVGGVRRTPASRWTSSWCTTGIVSLRLQCTSCFRGGGGGGGARTQILAADAADDARWRQFSRSSASPGCGITSPPPPRQIYIGRGSSRLKRRVLRPRVFLRFTHSHTSRQQIAMLCGG